MCEDNTIRIVSDDPNGSGYTPICMSTPAQRLKDARERAGFPSAAGFAKHVDVPEVTYRSHENGTRGLSIQAARRYAPALRTSWQWLMFGDGTGAQSAYESGQPVNREVYKVVAHMAAQYMRERRREIPLEDFAELCLAIHDVLQKRKVNAEEIASEDIGLVIDFALRH